MFFIGVCTALIACTIDICVAEISKLKYGFLKQCNFYILHLNLHILNAKIVTIFSFLHRSRKMCQRRLFVHSIPSVAWYQLWICSYCCSVGHFWRTSCWWQWHPFGQVLLKWHQRSSFTSIKNTACKGSWSH